MDSILHSVTCPKNARPASTTASRHHVFVLRANTTASQRAIINKRFLLNTLQELDSLRFYLIASTEGNICGIVGFRNAKTFSAAENAIGCECQLTHFIDKDVRREISDFKHQCGVHGIEVDCHNLPLSSGLDNTFFIEAAAPAIYARLMANDTKDVPFCRSWRRTAPDDGSMLHEHTMLGDKLATAVVGVRVTAPPEAVSECVLWVDNHSHPAVFDPQMAVWRFYDCPIPVGWAAKHHCKLRVETSELCEVSAVLMQNCVWPAEMTANFTNNRFAIALRSPIGTSFRELHPSCIILPCTDNESVINILFFGFGGAVSFSFVF